MINIIEFRIGNYCHIKRNIKESNMGAESSKFSALDKIRAAYNNNIDGTLYQIISINKNEQFEVSNPLNNEIQKCFSKEIHPVKLNPVLIRECGFKEKTLTPGDLTQKFLTLDEIVPIRISEYRDKTHFSIYVFDKHTNRNTYLRDISYLHQFQNLYFELTGKVVEINVITQ